MRLDLYQQDHSEPCDFPPTPFCLRTDSKPMRRNSTQCSSSGATPISPSSSVTLYRSQSDSGESSPLTSKEDLLKSEVPHAKSSDTVDSASETEVNIDQAFARMSVSCYAPCSLVSFTDSNAKDRFQRGSAHAFQIRQTCDLLVGCTHKEGGGHVYVGFGPAGHRQS